MLRKGELLNVERIGNEFAESRQKCWIDSLQVVGRIEQAATCLCFGSNTIQYQQRRVFAAKTLPMEYKFAGKQCTRVKWQKIRLCSKFKSAPHSFRQHSVTFPFSAVICFEQIVFKKEFVSSITKPALKFARASRICGLTIGH